MRIIATGIFALMLAACAQTQTVTFNKPGFDLTTFNADWYQCRRENGIRTVTVDPGNAFVGTTVQQRQDTNFEMASQCMMARGYTIIQQGQRPAS